MYEVMVNINGLVFTSHTDDWTRVVLTIDELHKVTDKVFVTKAGENTGVVYEKDGDTLPTPFLIP